MQVAPMQTTGAFAMNPSIDINDNIRNRAGTQTCKFDIPAGSQVQPDIRTHPAVYPAPERVNDIGKPLNISVGKSREFQNIKAGVKIADG